MLKMHNSRKHPEKQIICLRGVFIVHEQVEVNLQQSHNKHHVKFSVQLWPTFEPNDPSKTWHDGVIVHHLLSCNSIVDVGQVILRTSMYVHVM